MVPKIGLEAVLLRPANERIDVDRAIGELEQASLVELTKDVPESEIFISVPRAAIVFGRRKLVTHPFRIAIEADLQIMLDFGPTTNVDVTKGLAARVAGIGRAAAAKADLGQDIYPGNAGYRIHCDGVSTGLVDFSEAAGGNTRRPVRCGFILSPIPRVEPTGPSLMGTTCEVTPRGRGFRWRDERAGYSSSN